MSVYFIDIKSRPHRALLIAACFLVTVFALIGTHGPANAAPEDAQEGSRFLLLQEKLTPTPTPTPTPTLTPTPSPTPFATPTFPIPTPTPTGVVSLFKNSAAGSSAGLALGSMAGILFVLRRKDDE